MCDEYGVQATYMTMQVCTFMHMYTNSVRSKNPKSTQMVHAQSLACVCVCVCVAWACVCVCVCVCVLCVCMCVCVWRGRVSVSNVQ